MNIEIISKSGKEIVNLNDVLQKKFSKLEKFFSGKMNLKVVLSQTKGGKSTMEATVYQTGMPVPVRAEATSDDVFENIDILIPKLEKQIVKFRTRQNDRKKARIELPAVGETVSEIEKQKYGKVVKVKNFSISKVTVEDAIEEMELLDHNFYVFHNAEDDKVSVVYKRLDGDYGLITPEI